VPNEIPVQRSESKQIVLQWKESIHKESRLAAMYGVTLPDLMAAMHMGDWYLPAM